MSQIHVADLTFGYEGSPDYIFENVSFSIDSDWKLGFIGRNGKGKTTFLHLLMGKYPYSGLILSPVLFDQFPYHVPEDQMGMELSELLGVLKPGCEEWRVICELSRLDASAELLYRPFRTLSHGERTKAFLAILFSGENDLLLIDEPTDHLDAGARETVKGYLNGKKSFILVSHDRDLLDACTDHVLVLERKSIRVEKGNFSSWQENKARRDHFAQMENEKHLRAIASLKKAARQSGQWAQKNEDTKIGYDPAKEHDRSAATRAYIGKKTKKMQKRVKQYEKRIDREIQAREGLLADIEEPVPLKLNPLAYHRERLLSCKDLAIRYKGRAVNAVEDLTFSLTRGERVFLHGKNGCGKSTFLKALLAANGRVLEKDLEIPAGELQMGSGLVISYVSQDTSFLHGSITDFCRGHGLDESLFCALLAQLGLERVQFAKDIEGFSQGQKKKILLAESLMTPAHLYIWDEPLNYIDVFSRMQIEELLLSCRPTMLLVDHDTRFRERIATRVVEMGMGEDH